MNRATPTQSESAAATWQQIEGLVDEVAQLSKSEIAAQQFHAELLGRAVRALAPVAGAVWLRNPDDQLVLDYQISLPQALDQEDRQTFAAHQRLLSHVMAAGQPTLVGPRSGPGGDLPEANPTDHLLVLCPILLDQDAVGVVELFQQADQSPAAEQGNLQLLSALCQLAADFHRNQQLRELRRRERLWEAYDQFLWHIHQPRDVQGTAYAIANEGRRLIECDRLSVLAARGWACRLRSISGVDWFDRRSNLVRKMERLVDCVVRGRQPLWMRGQSPVEDPQTEEALKAYLEESPSRLLGLVPLLAPADDADEPPAGRVVGALVVEQFEDPGDDQQTECRTLAMARHCAAALHRAISAGWLPLVRVRRALEKLLRPRYLPRTLLVASAVLLVAAALVAVPADFDVAARGQLQPVHRETIYAPYDGTVVALPIFDEDGSVPPPRGVRVSAGEIVAVLHNSDLDYELTTVLGERETTQKQLDTIAVTRVASRQAGPSDAAEYQQLTAQEDELKVRLEALEERLKILRRQQAELSVAATISGRVQTWDVVKKLRSRPVRRGQQLMTIVDPDGPWVLELRVADPRIGHVLAAQQQRGEDLDVSYMLKSDPGVTYSGTVQKIAMATELTEREGASVLVTVRIDAKQLTDPRPGTTARAKIHCGRRPLGYVWLHDLVDFVRSRLLF